MDLSLKGPILPGWQEFLIDEYAYHSGVRRADKTLVFNPFHSFRKDLDLHRLTYKFSLSIPAEAPEAEATVTIEPKVYQARTRLSLPVRGRLLIHDGHDFYAHHRRLNTEHAVAKGLGLTRNFMRYSLDINPTDDSFAPFRGGGASNEDWYAWGARALAVQVCPGRQFVVARTSKGTSSERRTNSARHPACNSLGSATTR